MLPFMSNKAEMTFYFVSVISVKGNEYPIEINMIKYCDTWPGEAGRIAGIASIRLRQTRQSVFFL